jgi:hypothetical protein
MRPGQSRPRTQHLSARHIGTAAEQIGLSDTPLDTPGGNSVIFNVGYHITQNLPRDVK